MPLPPVLITPYGRYRRHIQDSDLSLQANTELTPEANRFYVFRGDRVVLDTEDFQAAEGEYRRLSGEFWEGRLRSAESCARLSSAWGLLGQDLDHRAARSIIENEGTPGDRKRLNQARMRRAAMRRAAASGRRYHSAF